MAQAGAGDRKELEQRVIQKAQQDSEFRSRLLADPKAALEQELGTSLPAGVQVQVVEETSNSIYLVLPQASSGGAGGELSDQDLEAVAGGWGTGGATTQQSCGTVC
jgi:hypothetical protein